MTSSVGGGRGSPKSRRKEQNQLICDSDKGGSTNPKILRTAYIEAPDDVLLRGGNRAGSMSRCSGGRGRDLEGRLRGKY